MTLPIAWFLVIAFLWTGYFVLEGFDFGVGFLSPLLGRDQAHRGALLHTIGPVWDGNEVWLITAGGATFAAFPDWYASLFSGFYLPLLLILVALIVRGVAIEYRGKRDEATWRRRADTAIAVGSLIPALGWGVAFAAIVHGVPMNAAHTVTGGLGGLVSPFSLLGGVTTLVLFATHAAVFLALRTTGDLRARARALTRRLGPIAAVLLAGYLAWMVHLRHAHGATGAAAAALAAAAVVCLAAGVLTGLRGRDGWSFTAAAASVALTVAATFACLYPWVLPASGDPAHGLTVTDAAASHYTLTVMSWAAVVFTPIVLIYQGWTYWVFRKRVTAGQVNAH